MTRDSGGLLLAADVYKRWKRLVQDADESVRIFSPYLDGIAADLLGNASLPVGALSVVTDLSPETGAQNYRAQLLAIRRLLNSGIEVRSLPRLHAKVLVIDHDRVTIGSQNFTRFGRGSRETTALPNDAIPSAAFIHSLDQWYDDSTRIDLALVERLLKVLDDAAAEAKRAAVALVDGYNEVADRYAAEKAAARQRRLEEWRQSAAQSARGSGIRSAATATRYRNARATAWARLTWTSGSSFRTLMTDSDTDLTRWHRVEDGRIVETVRLRRQGFYPLLLGPGERLGFANVTMSRISYVLTDFTRGRAVRVGDQDLYVRVSCPVGQDDGANLSVLFGRYREPESGYRLRIRFNGQEAQAAASGTVVGLPWKADDLARTVEAAHADPAAWAKVLSALLEPMPSVRGYRNDPNASRFFPDARIRIDLAVVTNQHLLLAQSDD